ncbi:hypothetical protein K435DRAFT_179664 [Dendrothele bispora CBS 962.96]|uniref:Uncharacterized protein n=1 Tax=Dendrothele bispora (strain CBS 962.96) TaxID=1314807 RepID=A0A4S8KTT6_DENBC|nr:hypothetical protein K435DRAFT_38586 [Dendrothele bispora CBS 962.96]THV04670.1 hypothetical protein K435DRAFT_179664 [Dendrothele bispora CBS 962.96]
MYRVLWEYEVRRELFRLCHRCPSLFLWYRQQLWPIPSWCTLCTVTSDSSGSGGARGIGGYGFGGAEQRFWGFCLGK